MRFDSNCNCYIGSTVVFFSSNTSAGGRFATEPASELRYCMHAGWHTCQILYIESAPARNTARYTLSCTNGANLHTCPFWPWLALKSTGSNGVVTPLQCWRRANSRVNRLIWYHLGLQRYLRSLSTACIRGWEAERCVCSVGPYWICMTCMLMRYTDMDDKKAWAYGNFIVGAGGGKGSAWSSEHRVGPNCIENGLIVIRLRATPLKRLPTIQRVHLACHSSPLIMSVMSFIARHRGKGNTFLN